MIKVKTRIDPATGTHEKNTWLWNRGLACARDWDWEYSDNYTNHLHTFFKDEHRHLATLFLLRWS